MSDATSEDIPKKTGKLWLLVLPVFLLFGAAGGYVAVSQGLIGGIETATTAAPANGDVSFVPIGPVTVSLGGPDESRFLRFSGHVEVLSGTESDVSSMMPRILDVLNTYLRSVNITDVEDPATMLEIRSHMYRRIDLVVGNNTVRDVLISEYVVN